MIKSTHKTKLGGRGKLLNTTFFSYLQYGTISITRTHMTLLSYVNHHQGLDKQQCPKMTDKILHDPSLGHRPDQHSLALEQGKRGPQKCTQACNICGNKSALGQVAIPMDLGSRPSLHFTKLSTKFQTQLWVHIPNFTWVHSQALAFPNFITSKDVNQTRPNQPNRPSYQQRPNFQRMSFTFLIFHI